VNVIEINDVRYTFIATVGVSFVYCHGVFQILAVYNLGFSQCNLVILNGAVVGFL